MICQPAMPWHLSIARSQSQPSSERGSITTMHNTPTAIPPAPIPPPLHAPNHPSKPVTVATGELSEKVGHAPSRHDCISWPHPSSLSLSLGRNNPVISPSGRAPYPPQIPETIPVSCITSCRDLVACLLFRGPAARDAAACEGQGPEGGQGGREGTTSAPLLPAPPPYRAGGEQRW